MNENESEAAPTREDLLDIARKGVSGEVSRRFTEAAARADAIELAGFLGMLTDASHGRGAESYRSSAQAMIEIRMTQRSVETMERLNKQAGRLSLVGIGVMAAGVLVAAAQLVRCGQ